MSWLEHHAQSEGLASRAQVALLEGRGSDALELYARAAEAEERALGDLDRSKERTLAASVVSAASLHYKAGAFERAEAVAYRWLGHDGLPRFAKRRLQELLQAAWSEQVRGQADVGFAPGQVLVSVDGGQVLEGGAPLHLIVETAKTIQALFHRTAEFMGGRPHRSRGAPPKDVQDTCRPWLFQAPSGSYQFTVAIQQGSGQELFDSARSTPRAVVANFLGILRASVEEPDEGLRELVPDHQYRRTFLALTRDLAPTGRTCERLEVRSVGESSAVGLDANVRKNLGRTIRRMKEMEGVPSHRIETIHGVVRVVHLDEGWLELAVDGHSRRVDGVGEEVDDIIGPLVNKSVRVRASVSGPRTEFMGIEPDG